MIENVEVKEGLLEYFKQEYQALSGQAAKNTGNFGDWCRFDPDVFCQEREGCMNCAKSRE